MAFYSLILNRALDGSTRQFALYCDAESESNRALRLILADLTKRINRYVCSVFGSEANGQEYVERIYAKLQDRYSGDAGREDVETAVWAELKSLVSKDQRKVRRAMNRHKTPEELDSLEHPRGLEFARRIDEQSEVGACLAQLPDELRHLMEIVYSLTGEELSRETLAAQLGIPRNTLDQRLARARGLIRKKMMK